MEGGAHEGRERVVVLDLLGQDAPADRGITERPQAFVEREMAERAVALVGGEGVGRALPAEEEPRGPRRHLPGQACPAGRRLLGGGEEAAPLPRVEVVLQERERDRTPALARELLHPGELGLLGRQVGGHLEDAAAELAQHQTNAEQLVLAGVRARHRLAVDGAVEHRARMSSGVAGSFLAPRSPIT